MSGSVHDSYLVNDYIAQLSSPAWKRLVIDDELRDLTGKVRGLLAQLGNHKVAPMYSLALQCLESGLFYQDSEQLRARLKAEMRDAVGKLEEVIATEGTQREREERRAEAIATDRRTIMASIRYPGDAMSFKLPLRWFDDWSQVRSHYDNEPVVPPRPDGGYKWDSGMASNPIEDLRRAHENRRWGLTREEFLDQLCAAWRVKQ